MDLCADDLVLYKVIQNETGFMELQSDIVFFIIYCIPPLYLNGQLIVEVKNYKYLGVHLTSDLK